MAVTTDGRREVLGMALGPPRRPLGWLAPLRHQRAKVVAVASTTRGPSARAMTTIGLDRARHVVPVHGIDRDGHGAIRQRLRRGRVIGLFAAKRRPCLVGMAACGTSHYGARELRAGGHDVRLMPAPYVKAYVT